MVQRIKVVPILGCQVQDKLEILLCHRSDLGQVIYIHVWLIVMSSIVILCCIDYWTPSSYSDSSPQHPFFPGKNV